MEHSYRYSANYGFNRRLVLKARDFVIDGSLVTKNDPSGSIVAGNPAKVIKSVIKTMAYGKMIL